MFLERDGLRLTGAASQPRRLALLALLTAAGEHGMTRDQMLAMLWSESDEERARKGLNQALYALRQEMGADDVFLGTRDVRLNPDLITSDLAAFTLAMKAGQLERAASEYIGPFLEGFHISEAPEFERWLEEERAGLARDYATALQRLAQRAAERGDRIRSGRVVAEAGGPGPAQRPGSDRADGGARRRGRSPGRAPACTGVRGAACSRSSKRRRITPWLRSRPRFDGSRPRSRRSELPAAIPVPRRLPHHRLRPLSNRPPPAARPPELITRRGDDRPRAGAVPPTGWAAGIAALLA